MKNDYLEPITNAIRQVLSGPLNDPAAIHLAASNVTQGTIPQGAHSHDTWELFCPVRSHLKFMTAGSSPARIPTRHLLIVPPGCLHMPVDYRTQSPHLKLLVMDLPGSENPYGAVRVNSALSRHSAILSPAEFAAWTTCVGGDPGSMMEQVTRAQGSSVWGRERALGILRTLVAAYIEVATQPQHDPLSLNARRGTEARIYLQSHYCEANLSADTIASALGISASHLRFLFRETTGRTLHHTLIDLRLRRATDLLLRTTFSIKEIAALTGWGHQLYFSAAFKKRHHCSPSLFRESEHTLTKG
jgi:AraC-like DNA-binding protein